MSDSTDRCDRFEEWLAQGSGTDESWRRHVGSCVACRDQSTAQGLLMATFEDEAAPRLSPSFDARLQARLEASPRVAPLRGWRLAAMIAYGALALAGLAWALRDAPLPAIDPREPWVAVLALSMVPASFALALFVSRFLPARHARVEGTIIRSMPEPAAATAAVATAPPR